jgi:4-hydroxy-tetrahydrodipicolinate synthase
LSAALRLHGVIPANLLPFKPDFTIDEAELRRHLLWLLSVPGVTGITCNGHAAEVATLTREECRQALSVVVDTVGGRVPVICGVYADGTERAVELARDARDGGADALLVFPPAPFAGGVALRPEMVLRHFAEVARAADLPLVVFEYPRTSGQHYTPQTLGRLAEEIPHVVAVKDWSLDILSFEENLRAIRSVSRPIAMLSSFSQSLLATLVLGADGILSGHASMIADLHAALFDAVQRADLAAARAVNDRLFALTQVFYAEPFLDMHNRMKAASVMLGRLSRCVVRPPLLPLADAELAAIRRALVSAGLLAEEVA